MSRAQYCDATEHQLYIYIYRYTVTAPINTQWCHDIISLRTTSCCQDGEETTSAAGRANGEPALDLIHEGCFYEVAAGRHRLLAGHKFIGSLQINREKVKSM